jgi:hypothetical protein
MNNISTGQRVPLTQELQYESCCIILCSEMLSNDPGEPGQSWLRDLLMSSEEIVRHARLRPTKSSLKARITQLKIHGKGNIFQNCGAEDQLRKYVAVSRSLGLMTGDVELQIEASNIIDSMEASSSKPSEMFVRFLNDLIFASTRWLVPFRARSNLESGGSGPRPAEISRCSEICTLTREPTQPAATPHGTAGDGSPNPIVGEAVPYMQDDSNCYRRLTRELSRFVVSVISPHNPNRHIPSDEELQYQARWIMFEE